jgi:hypothetical protein
VRLLLQPKDNILYYVSAKGENRRVVREAEKHRIIGAGHSDSTVGKYILMIISINKKINYFIFIIKI